MSQYSLPRCYGYRYESVRGGHRDDAGPEAQLVLARVLDGADPSRHRRHHHLQLHRVQTALHGHRCVARATSWVPMTTILMYWVCGSLTVALGPRPTVLECGVFGNPAAEWNHVEVL